MYILKFKTIHFTPDNGEDWYKVCADGKETLEFIIGALEKDQEIQSWSIEGHSSDELMLFSYLPHQNSYAKELKAI